MGRPAYADDSFYGFMIEFARVVIRVTGADKLFAEIVEQTFRAILAGI
jgi:hypothetical protein